MARRLTCGAIPYVTDTERDNLVKGLKKEFKNAVQVVVERASRIVIYHSIGSDNVDFR